MVEKASSDLLSCRFRSLLRYISYAFRFVSVFVKRPYGKKSHQKQTDLLQINYAEPKGGHLLKTLNEVLISNLGILIILLFCFVLVIMESFASKIVRRHIR